MSGHKLFMVTSNFRVKKFSELFCLQSTLHSEFFRGGSGTQLSLEMPNLRPKSFWIFLFTDCSGLWIFQGGKSGNQLSLVMHYLTSTSFQNIFHYQALWSLKFSLRGLVWVPTFFCHAKFEVKKFRIIFYLTSALDFEFFRESGGLDTKVFRIFDLQCTLDSEFFGGGSGYQIFFGHTKFEVKSCSAFFPLPSTLHSEFIGGSRHQLFLVTQIWGQKVFSIFSFTKCSGLWICQRVGVGAPTFFGHAKFELNKFWEFFHWQSTLVFEVFRDRSGLGTNFFWSCQI